MKIEVSNGEIVDKMTIIQIKVERITDEAKLENLRKEYDVLKDAVSTIISTEHELYKALYDVNCKLWDIEDRIRDLERKKTFDDEFVAVARSVYYYNDKRCDIKRKINVATDSSLMEEKSYEEY